MNDLEQQKLRGRQAAELLEHPLLIEAFEALEKEVMDKWKNSPSRDAEGRESLWMLLKLSETLKQKLQTHVETGKMADLDLRALEKRGALEKIGLL